ncbi:MAG: hypothetical protein Q9174_002396 [Haloplaca sp. 1 TL-2023]
MKLWNISLDAIRSIPSHGSGLLNDLQDLLIAGFQSHHKAIVNATIAMWNETFARQESLVYPTMLRKVLTSLRPIVDLDLPGFVDDEDVEVRMASFAGVTPILIHVLIMLQAMSPPFNFVDSQEDETKSETDPILDRIGASKPANGVQPAVARSPADISRQHGVETTPKARLRHDDSQIQFAAIESSPLIPEPGESQHLTIHQQEVKERQGESAAAMFPEIQYSPMVLQTTRRLPELILHTRQAQSKPVEVDDDAEPSPTYPHSDTLLNDFLGSSPTPRPDRKDPADRQANGSPASKSHGIPPLRESPNEKRTPGTPRAAKSTLPISNAALHSDALGDSGSLPSWDGREVSAAHQQLRSAEDSCIPTTTKRASEVKPDDGGVEETSDLEDFVDASADPVVDGIADAAESRGPEGDSTKSPGHDRALDLLEATPLSTDVKTTPKKSARMWSLGNDVGGTADTSTRTEPYTPTEDEQARDQLLRDLEEASSQGDSQVPRRRPSLSSPSKPSRKRQVPWLESPSTRKKPRQTIPSQSFEVVVETRIADERDDDCIIVDDRTRSISPAIKRERSLSPVAPIVQPSFLKTPARKRVPKRCRTRSMSSRQTQAESEEETFSVASAPQLKVGRLSEVGEDDDMSEPPRKKRRRSKFHSAINNRSPVHEDQLTTEAKSVDRYENDNQEALPDAVVAQCDDPTTSQKEGTTNLFLNTGAVTKEAASRPSSSSDDDTIPLTPRDEVAPTRSSTTLQPTPARSPGQRLLDRFRGLLNDLKQVTLWPQEEREIMEVAFEVVRDVHGAGGTRSERRVG